jgi:phospholipid transport system transporter-binding protein
LAQISKSQIDKSNSRWEIEGDITIAHAQTLLAESAKLPMAGALVVDLAKVTHVDTASISLMFEWLRHAKTKKCDLRFSNFPKNLLSLITLYGVVDLIPQIAH